MKKTYLRRPLYILFLSAILLTACKSHYPIVPGQSASEAQKAGEVFRSMKKNELKFQTLRAKFSMTVIKNGKKTKLSGQMRIKRDSLIWITLSPALGIEALRIVLSNDSVKFLDRIHKNYFVGDIRYVKDFVNTNIDLDVIQALLIGNDLTFYENAGFKLNTVKGNYQLISPSRRKLRKYYRRNDDKDYVFNQRITLKPNTYKIIKMKIKEMQRPSAKLEVTYDNFKYANGQLFPFFSTFLLNDGKKEYAIKIEYQKISIDRPLNFPFRISKKYKPLNLYEK